MRTNRKAILAAAMATALASSSLQATTLSWDADGTLPLGGSGTWDTVTPLWTPDGASYVNWNNATPDSPVFGGTAGAVTLAEPITTNGMTFNTANYVIDLNGKNLTVGGTATIGGANVLSNTTVTNTSATTATFTVGTMTAASGGNSMHFTGNVNVTLNGGSWSPANNNDFTGTLTFKPLTALSLSPQGSTTLGSPTGHITLDASVATASILFNTNSGNNELDAYGRDIELIHGTGQARLGVNGVLAITLSGSISGGTLSGTNSGLQFTSGQGNLILAGSNTYQGPTAVTGQNSILTLANNNALGATTGVSLTSTSSAIGVQGNIDLANTSDITLSTTSIPASGWGNVHNLGGVNRLSNNVLWSTSVPKFIGAEAGSQLTLAGAIGGTTNNERAGITKVGFGTLVLTGHDLYGTFNTSNNNNATAINEGTLRVDFSQANISTDIINSGNTFGLGSNQSSELSLGGGVLEVVGKSGDTDSQSFKNRGTAAVNVNPGFTINPGASAVRAVQNGANSLTINLGRLSAIQRFVGSTVDFTLPTAGAVVMPAGTNSVGANNTIITVNGAAFMTVDGGDWAALDAAGNRNIVGGSTLSGFYTPNDAGNLSGNADMSGGVDTVLTGSPTITSLRFNDSAAARTIDATGQTLSTGGILVSPAVGNNLSKITGGTLTGATGTANQDLVIIQNNTANHLRIESNIMDAGGVATALTKSGAGRLILSGSNSYTGETHINGGMLKVEGANALPSTGKLVFHGGVLGLDGGTTFSRTVGTSAGSVQFLGSGGWAAYGGDITINLNNAGNNFQISLGTGGTIPTGSALVLGASDATNTVNVSNPVGLRSPNQPQQHAIQVPDGAAAIDASLNAGIIGSNNAGGLTKTGAGVLQVGGAAATYTGPTIIEAGTLRANINAAFSNTPLNIRSGTLDLNGFTMTESRAMNMGGGAAGTSASLTTGAGTFTLNTNLTYNGNVANDNGATISGNLTMTAVRTFTVNDSTATANDLTVSAVIAGSGGGVAKAGAGTLKLAANNTYTGGTTVNAGNLVVGSVNALGTGSVTVNSGGTLQLQPGLAPVTIVNLTLAGTGKLDLTNDTLFTNSTLPATKSLIVAGNIITSSAGLVPGYLDAGAGSIKLRGTVPADANLDGTISSLDFDAMAANFNSNTNVFWQHGDFNGDGTVNMLDFNILATDFGQSVPPAPALGTLVPEPASMGLIALGTIGVMRRRRRSA